VGTSVRCGVEEGKKVDWSMELVVGSVRAEGLRGTFRIAIELAIAQPGNYRGTAEPKADTVDRLY